MRFRGIDQNGNVIWEQVLDAASDAHAAAVMARDQAEAHVAEHGGSVFVQTLDPVGDVLPKDEWCTGLIVRQEGVFFRNPSIGHG
jgi:hypothetical protein